MLTLKSLVQKTLALSFLAYMGRFVNSLGANSVGGIGSPMAGIRTFPDETNLYDKARALGHELSQSIAEKRQFAEQKPFHDALRARMSGLVDFMQEYWVFEREYWQKKPAR
jgi:hypothetical protein